MKKTEIFDKIKEILIEKYTNPDLGGPYNVKNITIGSKLGEGDIGFDSLDIVEVTMVFENEFGIELPDEVMDKITADGNKISDIVDLIAANLK